VSWLLPEWWGSGDPWRAAERAQQFGTGALATTAHPALNVVRRTLHLAPTITLVGLLIGLALFALRRLPRHTSDAFVGLAVFGLAWLLVVATMVQAGASSGIDRYLIVPLALGSVLSGASIARLVELLRVRAGGRRREQVVVGVLALAAMASAAPLIRTWPHVMTRIRRNAAIVGDLNRAIALSGGPSSSLGRCRPLYASGPVTPAVAWTLHRHLESVTDTGVARRGALLKGVLLRTQYFLGTPADPPLNAFGNASRHWIVARTKYWEVETAGGCG
jgi:hypothetical protein